MASSSQQEPIAIVGMACRLPGDITSPSGLWEFLEKERSAQSDIPANRVNVDAWYHPDGQRPGSINTRGGFFLGQDDAYRQFDPSFFGISPLEAATMDPQQRKLLETVYESFESAGVRLEEVSGSNTGCYVGNFTWDFGQLQFRDVDFWQPYQMTGSSLTILSNRINYVFNMKGPSFTIDTACSSTMYALHLACQSLRAGDCSAAVVGGTNLMLGIEQTIGSVRLQTVSPTSVSHTFDASADGYARGEAVGAVYIKRLADAVRDGNPIRAVIRGTAINANGKGPGISHPSTRDQEAVIRKAYANAGLGLDDTAYFEAHGTGTAVGDPIEFAAIGRVFAPHRQAQQADDGDIDPLLVGAVKTNLGHGEAASAIPSLLKVVLALERARIPATIGIRAFNPRLDFCGGALAVVQRLTPWPRAHAHYRRASVNSFGFGGANAHAILDAADSYLGRVLTGFARLSYAGSLAAAVVNGVATNGHAQTNGHLHAPPARTTYLLPFSAHNAQTATANIDAVLDAAARGSAQLRDLAFTLATRRSRLSSRAFALAATSSASPAAEQHLTAAALPAIKSTLRFGDAADGDGPGTVAFIFTGQGAQWPRMGVELVAEFPAVRRAIAAMDAALATDVPARLRPAWTIADTLAAPAESSRLTHDAERAQTVCTAVQVALVQLLAAWGVRPAATLGHSSGEMAAAYAAGLLTARQAVVVAYLRGLAVATASKQQQQQQQQRGAMLAVGVGAEAAAELIAHEADIGIACYNSPASVTLSGTDEAVDRVQARLDAAGTFNRKLATGGNAYHSWLMRDAGEAYAAHMQAVDLLREEASSDEARAVAMFSSVTGKRLETAAHGIPTAYWRTNLESRVLFDQAARALVQQTPGVRCLVEIGPHSALAQPLKDITAAIADADNDNAHAVPVAYLPSLKRHAHGVHSMLALAGSLFLAGVAVDLAAVNADDADATHGRHVLDLPPYQWVYDGACPWAESRLSREVRFRQYARHDLLGSRVPGSSKTSPSWRNVLRLDDLPWLRDHRAGGNIVFPAAGYVSLALVAATQAAGLRMSSSSGPEQPTQYTLRRFSIGAAMVLEEGGGVEVVVDLRAAAAAAAAPSRFDFSVSSIVGDTWITHASGDVEVAGVAAVPRVEAPEALQVLGHRSGVNQATQDRRWYETWKAVGMDYGPAFRTCSNMRSSWADGEALADVALRSTAAAMPAATHPESWYPVHPAALDACFQLAMVAVHGGDPARMTTAYLPVDSAHMTFFANNSNSDDDTGFIRARGAFTGLRSNEAHMELATRDGQLLFRGHMATVSMEGGQGLAHDDDDHGLQPYARLVWKPDIDYLATAHVEPLFAASEADPAAQARLEAHLKATVAKTEELAAMATLDSLARLPQDLDVAALPEHMARFVRSLQRHAASLAATAVGQLPAAERQRRIDAYAAELTSGAPEAGLVHVLNRAMPDIVSGAVGALDVMIQDGLLTRLYEEGLSQRIAHVKVRRLLDLVAHKNPKMAILEVGSGTGGATRPVLDALHGKKATDTAATTTPPPCYSRLTFTDVSTAFLSAAQDKFKDYASLDFRLLDIEKDPLEQGFEEGTYDLVFAANVIHATRDITASLRHCRKLLRPGGRILLIETTRNRILTNFILGTLPGFWLGADDGRPDGPFISQRAWSDRFAQAGFTTDVVIDDIPDPDTFTAIIVGRRTEDAPSAAVANGVDGASKAQQEEEEPVWLIYRHHPHPLVAEIERLYAARAIRTERCALADWPRAAAAATRTARAVMLAELESPLLSRLTEPEMAALRAFTDAATTAVWVTNGGVLAAREPEKMLGFGLGPSVRIEQPRFHVARVDVDVGADELPEHLQRSARLVVDVEVRFRADPACDMDKELVEHGGVVYAARYYPDPDANAAFNRAWKPTAAPGVVEPNMSLRFGRPGRLDSFYWQSNDASRIKDVGAGDGGSVLVDNRAFALDQHVVGLAKGLKNRPFFSLVSGGVVREVAASSACSAAAAAGGALREGDQVVCIAPSKLDTSLVVPVRATLKLEPTDTMEAVVGQLLPFTVAAHAVSSICNVGAGDTVLVDMASTHDGLGLALVQAALSAGGCVYATCASDEQRRWLAPLEASGLRLVDESDLLVGGAARGQTATSTPKFRAILTNGASRLSAGGHHLRDMVQQRAHLVVLPASDAVDLAALSAALVPRGVSVSCVDPLDISLWEEGDISAALGRSISLIRAPSTLRIPSQTFDLSQFADAAAAVEHDGSTVGVLVRSPDTAVVPVNKVPEPLTFNSDAFYIMIGCLGGLGRTLTMWMISRGARKFIYLSRSAADKPAAAELVRELDEMSREKHPLEIHVVRGDVSRREDVAAAIARARSGPIKGVVQAAMVLKDMLFANMDLAVWNAVVQPKCLGTLHLHELLRAHDLDFFTMTSSALGTLGAAMQSNYAAANAFLDAMARHRRALGLQGSSVALGMIVDAGHVEEHPDVERALVRNGLYRISLAEYLLNMEAAMRRSDASTPTPSSSSSSSSSLFAYDPLAAAHYINGLDPVRMPAASSMGGKNLWPNDNRLRHALHARDHAQASATGSAAAAGAAAANGGAAGTAAGSSSSIKARMAAAGDEGGDKAVQALVLQLVMERFSRLVLVPLDRLSASKALAHYGMDSMVSAELRNWVWHEFRADVPFMSLMDQTLTFHGLCAHVLKAIPAA